MKYYKVVLSLSKEHKKRLEYLAKMGLKTQTQVLRDLIVKEYNLIAGDVILEDETDVEDIEKEIEEKEEQKTEGMTLTFRRDI